MAGKPVQYSPSYWGFEWNLNHAGELCVHLSDTSSVRNLGFPHSLGYTCKGKMGGVPNQDMYKFITQLGHKVLLTPRLAKNFDGDMAPEMETIMALHKDCKKESGKNIIFH